MKRLTLMVLAIVGVALVAAMLPVPAPAADAPDDRVVVMYFHRTKRCPTCRKMGSYSEEAVKKGFADEVNSGTVAFYMVDFQDKKNAALTKGYKIKGPALVVAKITDKKVAQFTNLEDIWKHVGDKKAFVEYVQDNVANYIK